MARSDMNSHSIPLSALRLMSDRDSTLETHQEGKNIYSNSRVICNSITSHRIYNLLKQSNKFTFNNL